MVVSEPILLIVGSGTLVFTLAVSGILTAESRRRLEVHRVRTEVMAMRNHYARHVLAIRSDQPRPAPAGAVPPPNENTIPTAPGPVAARAAA